MNGSERNEKKRDGTEWNGADPGALYKIIITLALQRVPSQFIVATRTTKARITPTVFC